MEQPPSILKSPLPKHFSAQSHLGLCILCLLLHKTCLLQAEIQKLLIQSITWTILAHPYPGFFQIFFYKRMMNEIFSGVEGIPDSYFSLWMTVGRI